VRLVAGSPSSVQVDCSSLVPIAEEPPIAAAAGGISYDRATNRYTLVWKTASSDDGTCRRLRIEFDDGSSYTDEVRFR
jgi:hypothetical protein